jgi:microcystin-dependent protein
LADPFLGEIRIFAGNFAPRSWASCDGQLFPIAQNTALFSILGNYYGGDGRVNFALPNLMGRAPVAAGQGRGLSFRSLGQSWGTPTVLLTTQEMPQHNHSMVANATPGTTRNPTQPSGEPVNLARSAGGFAYKNPVANILPMNQQAIAQSGSNQPHQNMQAYLSILFIICIEGVYPKRQ